MYFRRYKMKLTKVYLNLFLITTISLFINSTADAKPSRSQNSQWSVEAEEIEIFVPPPDRTTPVRTRTGGNSKPGRKTLSELLYNLNNVTIDNLPTNTTVSDSDREDNLSQTTVLDSQNTERYRVLVEVKNREQEERVRSLYPEAFSTIYNQQSMLQIGVFSNQENAEKTVRTIKNIGLSATIIP